MTKYCVIPDQGEYIMGTYPNADRECVSSGGHVEDRGGGVCGSTSAVGRPDSGTTPVGAAAIGPIQALRERLPDSDVLRDLTTVNDSPALSRVFEDDEVRARAADVVGMVSQFSLLALIDPGSSTLTQAHYGDEMHGWLVGLADMVLARTDDEDLRAAVERLVDHYAGLVGQPVGALLAELERDTITTS